MQKIFAKCLIIVNVDTNGFKLCHMSAQTLHLYGFTEVIKFIVYIKKLLCKTVYVSSIHANVL